MSATIGSPPSQRDRQLLPQHNVLLTLHPFLVVLGRDLSNIGQLRQGA